MGVGGYIKTHLYGEFPTWAEREFEAVERAIQESITTNSLLIGEEVSGTTYTLVLGDSLKVKKTTSGSAVTITVPKDATANFPIGSVVHFYQEGAGLVTLAAEDGTITLHSRPGLKSAGQRAMFSVWKEDANVWVAFGDLTT